MRIKSDPFDKPGDFPLVLGGPLFQLFLRTQLSGPALEIVGRRIAETADRHIVVGNSYPSGWA
jgi:hypothetical protein